MPLFMMHGYPWSFTLLLKILPLLTDPAAHGGDPADAFTVVVPSLIGFGCRTRRRAWVSASSTIRPATTC